MIEKNVFEIKKYYCKQFLKNMILVFPYYKIINCYKINNL